MKTFLQTLRSIKIVSLLLAGIMICSDAFSQTYTTVAAGNWNNGSTWSGGNVPGNNITAGMTVNIQHEVNLNINNDLLVSGKLNIKDTLKVPASYNNKIIVNAGGFVTVLNGGLVCHLTARKVDFENNGRFSVTNSYIVISKSYKSFAGSKTSFTNSEVHIGDGYEMTGSATAPIVDTIQKSTLYISEGGSGDFRINSNCSLRVKNAIVIVNNGAFSNAAASHIIILPGAVSNYGFNMLKTSGDLENEGNWNARIDAHCIGGSIIGTNRYGIDLTRKEDCNMSVTTASYGTAPELIFVNPVLKSGQANKEGAVYRFANVTAGVDAEIRLKDFSRNDIVMQSIDLAGMGWDKAFQPQFGLPGLVQPYQNWYIDFELSFYKAGTNTRQKLAKVDMTALDVDGDGNSVSEYATFENPTNVIYSTVSYLTNQSLSLVGQLFACPSDLLSGPLMACAGCGGDGKSGNWNIDECTGCNGSGLKYSLCGHAYNGINGSNLNGPVENFLNIDTSATQVMATYQYVDKDLIKFRYGGKSGSRSSNGSGIRLNSLWFRQFNLAPAPSTILPVKIGNFNAVLDKNTVKLSWTGYEEDFSHYIMQRSTDGKNYEDIGMIWPTNNGNQWNEYKYIDMNVSSPTGTLFYRLQLVDKVEEYAKFSDVKVIRLKGEKLMELQTYPNPAINQVRLTLPSSWQGKPAYIELLNAGGKTVNVLQTSGSNQTENIDLSKLAKGIYFIRVSCDGETAQQRIIKN